MNDPLMNRALNNNQYKILFEICQFQIKNNDKSKKKLY